MKNGRSVFHVPVHFSYVSYVRRRSWCPMVNIGRHSLREKTLRSFSLENTCRRVNASPIQSHVVLPPFVLFVSVWSLAFAATTTTCFNFKICWFSWARKKTFFDSYIYIDTMKFTTSKNTFRYMYYVHYTKISYSRWKLIDSNNFHLSSLFFSLIIMIFSAIKWITARPCNA